MRELDRLLAMARVAEPDPLGSTETDALVRNARARAASTVDRVLDEARRAEPDPLTERELRAMTERAAMTGRARHRRWTRQRVMAASALAATLAAAAVTLFVLERGALVPSTAPVARQTRETTPQPTNLDLPTGDRLVAASGARFDVELPEPRIRRVRLGGGSMLFDVRPIERGRFTVSTPNAEVVVLGTVFSVEATETATTVWVYEGAVRVQGPRGARVVRAGGMLHLGSGAAGVDPLASAGESAAARRMRREELASVGPARDESAREEADPPVQRPEPSRPAPRARAPRVTVAAVEERVAPPAEPTTPADVRALIASGDAARALAVAEDAIARGDTDPWRMLEGDALRVLGRFSDAADAYQRAARELSPPRRQQAGFLEARVRMTELNDPEGALDALRGAEVTTTESALRERAMVLEVRLLARLGRHDEAADVARDYLRDYPEGPDASAMRARVAPPSDTIE